MATYIRFVVVSLMMMYNLLVSKGDYNMYYINPVGVITPKFKFLVRTMTYRELKLAKALTFK